MGGVRGCCPYAYSSHAGSTASSALVHPVALASALREYKGMWFGWSGDQTDEYTGQITFQRNEGVTTATVDLEEQDIDEEGQKRYQKRREGKYKQREQIPWRMRGRVEVGSNSESKADQRHESGNRVHNKNGREGMA